MMFCILSGLRQSVLSLLQSNIFEYLQPIIDQDMRRGDMSIGFVESKEEGFERFACHNFCSLFDQLSITNHNQSQSKAEENRITYIFIIAFAFYMHGQFRNHNLQLSIAYNILIRVMKNRKNADRGNSQQSTRETNIYKGEIKLGSSRTSWKDYRLKPELLQAFKDMGYDRPSDVQIQTLPTVLQQKDVIYQARSGMGKTSVFVVGILNLITPQINGQYMPQQCIVLAHTRELAYQICQEFKKHGKYFANPQLRIACVFGGQSIQNDMKMLTDKNKTPHILIGTVGRLIDLLQRGYINLKLCKFFVVDQCDYLLMDQQSLKEIRYLAGKVNKKAQKIMLSATIDETVISRCKQIMGNQSPQIIQMDEGKLSLAGMTQFYTIITEREKFGLLQHLLDVLPFDQAIIFVNKKQRVDKLGDLLDEILFSPIRIHSGLSQGERLKGYDRFKKNQSRVLVATNLFGRGIDILRVNLVINYDFPQDKQTYVHRVGRAGRFGGKGIVINFVRNGIDEKGRSDEQTLDEFCRVLDSRFEKLPKDFNGQGFL